MQLLDHTTVRSQSTRHDLIAKRTYIHVCSHNALSPVRFPVTAVLQVEALQAELQEAQQCYESLKTSSERALADARLEAQNQLDHCKEHHQRELADTRATAADKLDKAVADRYTSLTEAMQQSEREHRATVARMAAAAAAELQEQKHVAARLTEQVLS